MRDDPSSGKGSIDTGDLEFVELWFTDGLGFLKAVTIRAADLDDALADGVGIDGSSVPGFVGIEASDMIAMPDPSTFRPVPWHEGPSTGRIICDVHNPDGTPFEGDPRTILKKVLKKAADMGLEYIIKPELEYFYFDDLATRELLDNGGYMDLPPFDKGVGLRQETILNLQAIGIDVAFSHHEAAPGQNEIEVKMTDALAGADIAMTYRHVVKEIARQHDVIASFMPKPLAGVHGSGMHVHQMLMKDGKNAFHDPEGEYSLSETARQFIAGLLKHSREITLVTNQWANSYKRLMSGFEAPIFISWGDRNRSTLIRLPNDRSGNGTNVRVEYRSPDPACNPYLALSMMLSAGLEGIENAYEPPEPVDFNVHAHTKSELSEMGLLTLPESLHEAIKYFEESELAKATLGPHTYDWLLETKRSEWNEYKRHVAISVTTAEVTEFELRKFLPLL